MILTFDSDEPVERVVAAVSAVYGVQVEIVGAGPDGEGVPGTTGASPDQQRGKHDKA